jgi:tetratricopeptide (TPR) repeat protein
MQFTFLVLLLGIAGVALAADAPVTPAQARTVAEDCAEQVFRLNQSVADHYFHDGGFLQAVDVLERNFLLDPRDVETYASAAWLAWSGKDTDRAMRIYERMISANPDRATAYFEVGVFYMRTKRDAEAARWFADAVQRGLPSPQRHLYGHTLVRLGRTADAIAFWEMVLKENPNEAVAKRELEKLRAQPKP